MLSACDFMLSFPENRPAQHTVGGVIEITGALMLGRAPRFGAARR